MTLAMLLQMRAAALARANTIDAAAAGRAHTAEESAQINAALAEVKGLDAQIATKQALMAAQRTEAAVSVSVASGAVVGHNNQQDRPWASFGEQLAAVATAAISQSRTVDPRLFGALGSSETVDSEGGFLVAPEYSTTILQRTFEEGLLTSRCDTYPVTAPRTVMNALNEDSRLPGFRYGGIAVYRIAEAGLYTATKPNFKQVELNMNKLIGLMYATDEIMADTRLLQSWAEKNFPKAFGFQLDDEVYEGSGAGQFLGFQNSPATIVVPKDTGQATNTVTTSNILNMHNRLLASSRDNAVWFINQDVEPALYTLTIPGNMGTAVALYTPPGQLGSKGKYGSILNHPVIPIEQANAFSSQGDISLCDMSQYIIGEKQGVEMASSIHVAFLTGEQAFKWTMRNDGKPIQKAPLTPFKGTLTKSNFVTLGAR